MQITALQHSAPCVMRRQPKWNGADELDIPARAEETIIAAQPEDTAQVTRLSELFEVRRDMWLPKFNPKTINFNDALCGQMAYLFCAMICARGCLPEPLLQLPVSTLLR